MTTMNEKFTMADMLKFQKQMNKNVDTAKRNLAARRNMVDVEKTGGKKRHIMMPKNILDKIPPLYAQDGVKDPTVYVKFFNPRGSGTWLGTEYDPASKEFFGYVMGMGDDELGYFALKELEMNGIERDESFRPKKLSVAKSKVKQSMGMKESVDESLGELISRLEVSGKLSEGYEEFKKDPGFFDEKREGGKYVATKMDPKKGIAYSVIKKSDAEKIRKHKGYDPHPDGWLSIYFVPAPYATKSKMAIDEVKRGMFKPVWDWGTGPRKGGWG